MDQLIGKVGFILEEKDDEENCRNTKEYKEIIKYRQSIIETIKKE